MVRSSISGSDVLQCTEVHFVSFFSGGFINAIVVNPPERKLAKRTSVQWGEIFSEGAFLFDEPAFS